MKVSQSEDWEDTFVWVVLDPFELLMSPDSSVIALDATVGVPMAVTVLFTSWVRNPIIFCTSVSVEYGALDPRAVIPRERFVR